MLAKATRVLRGVGIHTGKPSTLQILPPSNTIPGIHFQTITGPGSMPATFDKVTNTGMLRTELGGRFQTVEHIMAALFGLNVFHAMVQVEGETGEVPILDGGSLEICDALLEAGIVPPSSSSLAPPPPPLLRVCKQVEVENRGAFVRFDPLPHNNDHDQLIVHLSVEFAGMRESFTYEHDYSRVNPSFLRDLAPAKTFAMENEAVQMRALGLGLGANPPHNCIVYSNNSDCNNGGARVKHKLLDLLGDLKLCGHHRLIGEVRAHRTGHALNHRAVQALMMSSSM